MILRKFAIIGYPLEHSKSPQIHNHAFARTGYKAIYEKIAIHPDRFARQIEQLKAQDWAGFNITNPFKEDIIPFLDDIAPEAYTLGAVNTIAVDPAGRWTGYNTDYIGFITPLIPFKDDIRSVLGLGAGGAAKAVVAACLQNLLLKRFMLANRNPLRAQELVDKLPPAARQNCSIAVSSISDLPEQAYDLIVNCTSVGMGELKNQMPADPVRFTHPKSIVYDLIYNPSPTLFLERARQNGLKTLDGLPMLVFQAGEAYKIWTGTMFDSNEMLSFLDQNR